MDRNVCRFVPNRSDGDEINFVHFVYETKPDIRPLPKCDAFYRIHLCAAGEGTLHAGENHVPLRRGDVFFTFPSVPYSLSAEDGFEYFYISYLGVRANRLTEQVDITRSNPVRHGAEKLIPIWRDSITDDHAVLSLRCEGLLLYTLSILKEKSVSEEKSDFQTVSVLKKYIDGHFTDPNLSLESVAREFSYNKKYLSSLFKKSFSVGITQYVTTLRIQYACTLFDRGFSGIRDVAFLCGYTEPLYFSKVFKEKIGESPRAYLTRLRQNGSEPTP